jgi:transcriptional regulator with XRE-family HTH domain
MERHGQRFAELVGLELKGMIAANGFTQAQVAEHLGHSPTALGRWLKGKPPITVGVLYDICNDIKANPKAVIEKAYNRLLEEEFTSQKDSGASVDNGARAFLAAMQSVTANQSSQANPSPASASEQESKNELGIFSPFTSRDQMHQFVEEVIIPQLRENHLFGLAAEENPDKTRETEGGEDR